MHATMVPLSVWFGEALLPDECQRRAAPRGGWRRQQAGERLSRLGDTVAEVSE